MTLYYLEKYRKDESFEEKDMSYGQVHEEQKLLYDKGEPGVIYLIRKKEVDDGGLL